jgi:NADPH-dependent curcumin reductase CurA
MTQTELHTVPGWTANHVAQLAKSWITSAEQVVAVSATSGGVESLAQQLNVSEVEARRLIGLARAALTPRAQAEMGQRFDSDDRGMGVMHPGKEDGNTPTGKK